MPTKLLSIFAFLLMAPAIWAKGIYMSAEEFIESSFPDSSASPQVLWLSAELKQEASYIANRKYRALRARYWSDTVRSAWIFEEIGKELPITIGIVINDQKIEDVKILAFRESRGGDVKYPFFTNQFKGVALTDKHKLDNHIDGITGATLSVWAVKRAARLALYFHQQAFKGKTSDHSP